MHLVAVRIDEPHDDDAHWKLLSEMETRRAQRFRLDEHRSRWVAARALLKRLAARYVECDPMEIRLGFGEIGKPFLKSPNPCDLRFNYTDSGGCLIYAFARGFELGVDLEKLPRSTNYTALAARKLSQAERAVFEQVPPEGRELAFLASWTRKEAYGKALGVGIRYPMHEISLMSDYSCEHFDVEAHEDSARPALRLTQIQPPFPGIACLAAASRGHAIRGFAEDIRAT